MKCIWTIDDDTARLELIAETVTDRSIIEGLGNAQSAQIKRNSALMFIIDLPKQPVAKPTLPRPADEVRDQLPLSTEVDPAAIHR